MIKREEFTFDSRDQKSKIHAIKWLPETENVVCVVQLVHGMAEYIARYDEFARFLAGHGIVVVGNDHLGHGDTARESGMPFGYFCDQDPATVAVRDVHRLKKITQEQYLGVPYIIIGHSMGSFILRNYLMRYGKGIDGAIILGTGIKPKALIRIVAVLTKILTVFQGKKHKSLFINALAFGTYEKRIENKRTTIDWFSSDADAVDKYLEDDLCGFTFTLNGFSTLFELIKRTWDQEGLKEIPKKLPILIASGTQDPVGDYGEGPKKLYDEYLNLDLTKVQLKLYNECRHELLNEGIREQVYKDLLNWILSVV